MHKYDVMMRLPKGSSPHANRKRTHMQGLVPIVAAAVGSGGAVAVRDMSEPGDPMALVSVRSDGRFRIEHPVEPAPSWLADIVRACSRVAPVEGPILEGHVEGQEVLPL